MRSRIDDHRERHFDFLPVDQEGEGVFVDVVVARIDDDAPRPDLLGCELLDGERRLQEIGDGDLGQRRRGLLHHVVAAHQANVLKVVIAEAGKAGDVEAIAGSGGELDGDGDAGTGQLADGEKAWDCGRFIVGAAGEGGLNGRGDVGAGGDCDGFNTQTGALDLQSGVGDVGQCRCGAEKLRHSDSDGQAAKHQTSATIQIARHLGEGFVA